MNINFIASIRGGRSQQPIYTKIVELLKQYGTVFGEEISKDLLSEYGEIELSDEELINREHQEIKKSDVIVAEVTTPSLGVGYLVGQAISLNKKVVCLYQGQNTDKLSAMIKGNKNLRIFNYTDIKELPSIFKQVFKE